MVLRLNVSANHGYNTFYKSPYRLLWMTDNHHGDPVWNPGEEQDLADKMALINFDVGINTGDLTENSVINPNENAEYLALFGDLMDYNMKGNHDADGVGWLYHFYHIARNIKIIGFLAIQSGIGASVPASELEILENNLKQDTDKKKIVMCHYPVLSDFGGANILPGQGQEDVLALLSKYNVSLYLSGHRHDDCISIRNEKTLHISGAAAVYQSPNAPGGFMVIDFYLGKAVIYEYRSHEISLFPAKTIVTNI